MSKKVRDKFIKVEDPGPSRFFKQLLNPRWGAYLHPNAPKVMVRKEEEDDEEEEMQDGERID